MREMRAETKQLREKMEDNYQTLDRKIDRGHESLSGKMDATQKELGQLASAIDRIRNRFGALQWILSSLGALGGLIAGVATLGSAFHWF